MEDEFKKKWKTTSKIKKNGRQAQKKWKRTSKKNGRPPQKKMEADLKKNNGQTKWKTT
jgi:hypothetical protein